MSWSAKYRRFRAAVDTGALPSDLGTWALEQLVAAAPHCDRVEARDELIVEAADYLAPGSLWARAGELAAEIAELDRGCAPVGPARELLAAAMALDRYTPRSARQLFAILKAALWRFQTEAGEARSR